MPQIFKPKYGARKMIITKQNLAVLAGVAKTKENIYSLDHVQIDLEQGCIYASDGRCLFRSELDRSFKDDEFPEVGVSGSGEESPILVSGEELDKAEKHIPKKQSTPILETIQILSDPERHYIVTTDTKTTKTISTKRNAGEYPEVREIEAVASKESKAELFLGLGLLEKLVKALKKNGCDEIKIEIRDTSDPLVIRTSDKNFTGYLMPLSEWS